MNKALSLISLQHELAMAIGNKLDLKAMVKVFLKVCFSRLNLTSTHFYVYCDENGAPRKIETIAESDYRNLLSIPKINSGKPWQDCLKLSNFVKQLNKQQETIAMEYDNGHQLYGFIVPGHGFLVFETHYILAMDVQKALSPILNKLATSCYASLIHDSLVKEIHSRQLIEEKLAFQSQHDGLTGLFNRQHIKKLLKNAIEQTSIKAEYGCTIFIDLNKFKPINDAMGHSIGDLILLTLANRLNSLSNENVHVGRFGGDEFVIILQGLDQNYQKVANLFIKEINQVIDEPFIIKDNSYKLNCSIGYVFFPLQKSTASSLIKFADIAMYEAKREKNLQGKQYQPAMSDKINKRLAYVDDMKKGLTAKEFELYYQPQFNHHNEIIGAEALLRWNHPEHGIESPAIYIPIAEESDLILYIGQWVLEQACRDIKKLEQRGVPHSFGAISINVSAKQLIENNFQSKIMTAIEQNNISANRLALELTESLLIENITDSIELIASLKAKGVACGIDDFGTGYSSLTYLKLIPASILKIDRSFVSSIEESDESLAIVNMIISLGKALNMAVLAEGVETLEELNCLKKLGCYQYQGYFFNKALPFEEFCQLFDAQK
ncbi:bifunctional diguanylate cyclase/phosphodiesterase [Colwellia sp. 1_MG-2023]|uniref:putative bifunctional diguanylate cyclase/phosphodiesterase n=1 Tax=unclassified Colwellia TaxID=196834 RepID=UPI001C096BBD|nr:MULTISPECIES: bifunctional diguanylate cyclase/phosphodiesterase [unclassified Colwellia]MBU2924411.1 bifunctional diguanylate cyclase/phosphodiesterase [Colwellia sp. C2M11]MDO6650787.1 bifunctional diguanylate cyclase/phosphodiesterase [Colwellia sp. 3_MG-2023]MDO6663822.1 bifunctional diguanylate cyclase/phosphodiesterase [Colwellia sp. 2_MG-2023]MDO6688173.1 bifunctional diguanylate cyclase/phosphodiesterase [Colwellia sp. 1_MG-2023]